MDILDFDDHIGLLVPLGNGLHAWLEAWEDDPGGIRFMSMEGFYLVQATPVVQQEFEENEVVEEAASFLAGTAEMLFQSWREDSIIVIKNSLPDLEEIEETSPEELDPPGGSPE